MSGFGFGFGFGSAMEGLASGIRSGQAISNSIDEKELAERRLKIQEDAAARDASNDAYNRSVSEKKMGWAEKNQAWQEREHSWAEQDRARQEAERTANAPVLETGRKAALLEQQGKLSDAQADSDVRKLSQSARSEYEGQKAKSIMIGKDQAGNPTYTTDGESFGTKDEAEKAFESRHGSFMDAFYQKWAPQVRDRYLENGDTKTADVWSKWIEDKRVKKGIASSGRMLQSLSIGDLDGVNKHLNEIVKNDIYMGNDSYDIHSELLKNDGGSVVGLRGVFKDRKSGKTFSREFTNEAEFVQMATGVGNPTVMFENTLVGYKAERALAAKKAEKSIDTAFDIEKKNAELSNPSALKQKIYQSIVELGADRKTPEEIGAEVNRIYEATYGQRANGVRPNTLMPQQVEPRIPTYAYGSDAPQPSRPVERSIVRKVFVTPKPVGESVDSYAARLNIPVDNSQGRGSLDDYERRMGLKR